MAQKEKEEMTLERTRSPALTVLPAIKKVGSEAYSPFDTFSALSANIKAHPEGTYPDIRSAEHNARVSKNASRYLNEGSSSLASRFLQSLERI